MTPHTIVWVLHLTLTRHRAGGNATKQLIRFHNMEKVKLGLHCSFRAVGIVYPNRKITPNIMQIADTK